MGWGGVGLGWVWLGGFEWGGLDRGGTGGLGLAWAGWGGVGLGGRKRVAAYGATATAQQTNSRIKYSPATYCKLTSTHLDSDRDVDG